MIGILSEETRHRWLRTLRCPFVNVSSVGDRLPPSSVVTDNAAIGRMAAEFLLRRGFQNFGFCGLPYHRASVERQRGFATCVAEAGFRTEFVEAVSVAESAPDWSSYIGRLSAWLLGLPKPTGILAFNDLRGRDLLDACQTAGLRVPDDIAVVGVDNDVFLCETAVPMLASVDANLRRLGQSAAELLESLIGGGRAPAAPIEIPPTGVVARLSADIHAVADPRVADAIRFIREHADRPIRSGDVVRGVPVARRSLERRFRKALGRSLEEEIRSAHIERARRLLSDTTLSVEEVGERSGFLYTAHFSAAFKRATGLPPAAWRRAHARGG